MKAKLAPTSAKKRQRSTSEANLQWKGPNLLPNDKQLLWNCLCVLLEDHLCVLLYRLSVLCSFLGFVFCCFFLLFLLFPVGLPLIFLLLLFLFFSFYSSRMAAHLALVRTLAPDICFAAEALVFGGARTICTKYRDISELSIRWWFSWSCWSRMKSMRMMVLKQVNWKQGKTCAIEVYRRRSQYRERMMNEVVYQEWQRWQWGRTCAIQAYEPWNRYWERCPGYNWEG